MEGVAYNSRWLLGYVERFVKRTLPGIRAIGGGVQSDLWCQILADVLGRDIHRMENPLQANTRGAALLAALALGALQADAIGDCVRIERTFAPDSRNRPVYDRLFPIFLELYRRHSRLQARLGR